MRWRDVLAWCATGALLVGCSLPRRRFVDPDGHPVAGALVVSVDHGDMLFGGARATAFLTDGDGWAPIASPTDVIALAPGCHPWTHVGLEDRGRSAESDDRNPVVLHRRSGRTQPTVHVSRHQVTFVNEQDELQPVQLPPEIGVHLELVDRTCFRVRAKAGGVRASRRFFFAGPSSGAWVETLSQEDDLFFYAQAPSGRVHKVGVTRFHDGSMTVKREIDGVVRQVAADAVTLLWADLGEQCSVVEPAATPVRIGWIDQDIELIAGPDSARVADALEDAVSRGDAERDDSVAVWSTRLRGLPTR